MEPLLCARPHTFSLNSIQNPQRPSDWNQCLPTSPDILMLSLHGPVAVSVHFLLLHFQGKGEQLLTTYHVKSLQSVLVGILRAAMFTF